MADKHEVTLRLNARFLPIHRFDLEDALQHILNQLELGEVDGGGTYQAASGEVMGCEIVMLLVSDEQKEIKKLAGIIESMGMPNGSRVIYSGGEIPVGTLEGLAVYLNGTDLPAEVYQSCNVNHVISSLEQAMEGVGRMYSYWEGQTVTGLYFYGQSYDSMLAAARPFLDEYPLCRECRTEKIS